MIGNTRHLGFTLFLLAAGCNTLPAGRISDLATRPASALDITGEVHLLRGWRGLWSEGIDTLAGELRNNRVAADVFQADQKNELADALIRRSAAGAVHQPLVLIGFSYGADDAIEVAESLGRHGIVVNLLITIDPVTPPPVPGNVVRCLNFYQSNGLWDAFPWLRGIPLPEPKDRTSEPIINCNIRDRADLLEPGTSHATIAGNPKLHQEIVRQVRQACQRG